MATASQPGGDDDAFACASKDSFESRYGFGLTETDGINSGTTIYRVCRIC